MPLFEYQCKKCGNQEEMIVSFEFVPKCHKCGSTMKKMVARANFELKGRGWARDNYAGSSE